MLTFFYDSLESLKKVKKPTAKEVLNLTVLILIVVVISALLFAVYDGVFATLFEELYNTFYL